MKGVTVVPIAPGLNRYNPNFVPDSSFFVYSESTCPNGDITSDKYGKAHNEFDLIVQEAFSSTLVDGKRVPIASRFILGKGGRFRFTVAGYDTRRSLVIDPGLADKERMTRSRLAKILIHRQRVINWSGRELTMKTNL